jgi:hypothetical protein
MNLLPPPSGWKVKRHLYTKLHLVIDQKSVVLIIRDNLIFLFRLALQITVVTIIYQQLQLQIPYNVHLRVPHNCDDIVSSNKN